MCDKCAEFDFKIAHYRQMATELTRDGIAGLIKELANAKAALHPEKTK
jgi:hypothetical protein